ncbi:MAG: UvrD-helicase domain-containing protein [Spirochaetales bacterium]|nr:UvrD-helicase domain-containing protein [Spirochaetales bacterium]
MKSRLKAELNPRQYEAASTVDGPVLIIAGAGSGKTRMITYRIAYMLSLGIAQSSILALTFTNKAAREMAERIRELTGKKCHNLTASTFHAFGATVLREQIGKFGFRENFSIYDQQDKTDLIKEVAREMKIPLEKLDFYELSNLFSGIKTGRMHWSDGSSVYRELYHEYNDHLKVYNAVDFDDLIVLPIRLFKAHPPVLEEYRKRYRYIMVDEFQDTSLIQYELLHLLGGESRNVCVVGDDDQSIYSWRGANYQNIQFFERDYPELKEVKLEQNYRSTGNILSAANTLIANNKTRKEKELWTGAEKGKSIELYYPDSELDEGIFIAEMIRSMHVRENVAYQDIGILVRTNSLTATIEECLLAENIPYHISGGTSFFQRREIKDLISYLRVLANPDDDINLLRIINRPRRGIGKTSLEYIHEIANSRHCSMYSAISAVCRASDSTMKAGPKEKLQDFITMIEFYREKILTGRKMAETVKGLVDHIDYWAYLLMEHQKNDKLARWKYANLQKFNDILQRWETDPDNIDPNIFAFLNRISLVTRDDVEEEEDGKIQLMTIHSAKGLEFDIVFLAGVEDHIIPHARSLEEDEHNIEEERRLFYVAITRARRILYMTACRTRKMLREKTECLPSRFLEEIPAELVEYHQKKNAVDIDEAIDYFAKMKKNWDSDQQFEI